MIAAIILAAGSSNRLGHPKQLIELRGETLLHRTIRTAHEAGCAPIFAVLGARHAEILAHSHLPQAITLINPAWQEGIASSIRLGVQAIPGTAEGAVLLTCDQPAVSATHLRLVMTSRNATASSYAGRQGVPAYFPVSMFSDLLKLHGDSGASKLLQSAPAIELPDGDLDVDTEQDLANAKLLFG